MAAARPQVKSDAALARRPAAVIAHIAQATPAQHPLALYEQLLTHIGQGEVA